jgi:hypothetical protein
MKNLCEFIDTDIVYKLSITTADNNINDVNSKQLSKTYKIKPNFNIDGLDYLNVSEIDIVMNLISFILKDSKLINNVFVLPFPKDDFLEKLYYKIVYKVFPEKKIRSGYFKEGFEEKGCYIF